MKHRSVFVKWAWAVFFLSIALRFSGTLRRLFSPVFLAVLLAWSVRPFYRTVRARFKKPVAACIVYGTLSVFFVLLLTYLLPTLKNGLYTLMNRYDQICLSVQDIAKGAVDEVRLNIWLGRIETMAEKAAQNLEALPATFGQWLLSGSVTFILSYYFLTEWERLTGALIRLFPEEKREDVTVILRRTQDVFGGFLKSRLLLMLFMTAGTFLLFWCVGVPSFFAFSLFAGLMDVVPYIGAFLGGVFPVAFLLTESPQKAVLLFVLLVLLQAAENFWFAPKVTGEAVRLHPAVVVFLIFAGGTLFGVWGVLLSVPVGAVIHTVGEYVLGKQ